MAYKETDTCWHIVTITEGGKVSILKNLDAPTARQTYQRLKPDSRPARYLNTAKAKSSGWGYACSGPRDGEIRKVEIIGPEGVELNPWRGVEPLYYDMATNEGYGPLTMPPEQGRKLAAEEDARAEQVSV